MAGVHRICVARVIRVEVNLRPTMSNTQANGLATREQGPAIGESLRILSVVTSFGAGGAALKNRSGQKERLLARAARLGVLSVAGGFSLSLADRASAPQAAGGASRFRWLARISSLGWITALIQVMAAARPFVSTAVGGVRDIVTGEERLEEKAAWFTNGVLVAAEAASFVAVLRAFAQDRSLLGKLGSTGWQWALANYAEPKRPDATHQLYSEYLAGGDRGQSPPLPPRMAHEFAMTRQLTRLAESADFISSLPPHPDCATDTSSPPCSTDATAGQFAPIPPASA